MVECGKCLGQIYLVTLKKKTGQGRLPWDTTVRASSLFPRVRQASIVILIKSISLFFLIIYLSFSFLNLSQQAGYFHLLLLFVSSTVALAVPLAAAAAAAAPPRSVVLPNVKQPASLCQ